MLVARGEERLDEVAKGLGAEAEVCDVSDRAQVEEVAGRIGERHPAVHLLVNNAGFGVASHDPICAEGCTAPDSHTAQTAARPAATRFIACPCPRIRRP